MGNLRVELRFKSESFRWVDESVTDEREQTTLITTNSRYLLGYCLTFVILANLPAISHAASGPSDSDLSSTNSGTLHGTIVRNNQDSPTGSQVVVRSNNGDFREVISADSMGN